MTVYECFASILASEGIAWDRRWRKQIAYDAASAGVLQHRCGILRTQEDPQIQYEFHHRGELPLTL